jgi:hypothetical protein
MSSDFAARQQQPYNPELCDARIWGEKRGAGGRGYDDIQCSSKKVDGCGVLCTGCFNKRGDDGKLWTGLITEDRPEFPMCPAKDLQNEEKKWGLKQWSTDKDGNDVVKENTGKKTKKNSFEKKSRKPKKKSPEDMDFAELTKYMEELEALLAKAKKKEEKKAKKEAKKAEEKKAACIMELAALLVKEEKKAGDAIRMFGELQVKFNLLEERVRRVDDAASDDEDMYKLITIDGVEYQIFLDPLSDLHNTVVRVDDFSPVGMWNAETGSIDFDEENE